MKLCFCATLLGRGAVRAFLGAYFKIHKIKEKRKKNFWGIRSLCFILKRVPLLKDFMKRGEIKS